MGKSDDVLRQFVSKKSRFLDVPDGEEVVVQFMGVEAVETNFKGTPTQSLRYHFIHDEVEKSWDRTSREFARQMMAFKEGEVLKIKRIGQRNNTKYEITRV